MVTKLFSWHFASNSLETLLYKSNDMAQHNYNIESSYNCDKLIGRFNLEKVHKSKIKINWWSLSISIVLLYSSILDVKIMAY